jgi:succinyl-CoA synthetase alpha subunit
MTDVKTLQECISGNPTIIVQGITGRTGRRHAGLMRAYGTRIVAGTSKSAVGTDVDGIPVFPSCAEAVRETGAHVSVAFVPATSIFDAVHEAVEAGVRLVVTVAEGMPVHDAARTLRYVREKGALWLGPSTPGFAVPGVTKVGFLPDVCLRPGPVGVLAKSGTLSYEVCHRLATRGIGQSAWIGVGGETIKGMCFADFLNFFDANDATEALVVLGEIGGNEEEDLAEQIILQRFSKPVFALVAGASAPEGRTMGHAGALVHGAHGTVSTKRAALIKAGAAFSATIDELVTKVTANLETR